MARQTNFFRTVVKLIPGETVWSGLSHLLIPLIGCLRIPQCFCSYMTKTIT